MPNPIPQDVSIVGELTPNPVVNPGDTYTFEVVLNEVCTSDQPVTIMSTPSTFSSIPSSVTVLQGDNSATFLATVSTAASGSAGVAASCNSVAVALPIQVEGEPPTPSTDQAA